MKTRLTKKALKSKELYEDYRTKVIKDLQVSKKEHIKIIKSFAKKFLDKVLLESEEVKLPVIGTIKIKKFKQDLSKKNQLRINWALTKKHNKKIYHLNDHRNGYIYRFKWTKAPIPNRKYYSFLPERYNAKRRLAKILKETKIEYFS